VDWIGSQEIASIMDAMNSSWTEVLLLHPDGPWQVSEDRWLASKGCNTTSMILADISNDGVVPDTSRSASGGE
jgi:hypothetical protein